MGNDVNVIVLVFKTPERIVIKFDNSNNKNVNRLVSSLVIQLAGPVPYSYVKVMPYKYNATVIDNVQEVPLPTVNSVVSLVDVVKVTRSGHVFGPVSPRIMEDASMGKKLIVPAVDPVSAPTC